MSCFDSTHLHRGVGKTALVSLAIRGVDTGVNKTLVGEEDADTLHDQTPSDITITGTAGKTKAISDGFILASGRDSDDETVEFKFRCSALGSMKMNLFYLYLS